MRRQDLQQLIAAAPVSHRAKVVGFVVVSHWSTTADRARLRLDTIAAEIGGASTKTVTRGVNELIKAGIFERKKTGRASILTLGAEAQKINQKGDCRSDTSVRSKPQKRLPTPRTGTRFLEFCPADEREESAAEMAVKDAQFYLGF